MNASQKTGFKTARTLHCSTCGGTLEKGRSDCPFCGALIDLTDAPLTSYCSLCFSMSKEGATYCSDCGEPIDKKNADTPGEAEELCPRCRIKMRRRTIGDYTPLECPMCLGIFVQSETLDKMIKDQEQRVSAVDQGISGGHAKQATLNVSEVAYVKCPVCSTIMNRANYGRISGVIIDYCREHGYWLDAGELEKIAKWVSTGGLDLKRKRELQELKIERSRTSVISSPSMYNANVSHLSGHSGVVDLASGILSVLSRLFR